MMAAPPATPSSLTPLHQIRQLHKSHLHLQISKICPSNLGNTHRRILVAQAAKSSSSSAAVAAAEGGKDAPQDAKNGLFAASGFSISDIPVWAEVGLGILILLAIPSYRRILKIEDAVEKGAEKVVKFVESAADAVENAAEEIGDALPGGYLKVKVEEIEQMAALLEKSAKTAEDVIEKVDKITDKVEDYIEASDRKKEQENKSKEEEEEDEDEDEDEKPPPPSPPTTTTNNKPEATTTQL